MYINESGTDRVVFSGHIDNIGYGCCFSLSEITYAAIAKLLYFKIRYRIKERLRKWRTYLGKLFRT